MCANCPHNYEAEVSPWTAHVLTLHKLIEAGCRFGPDDLSIDEWYAVADMKAAIEADAHAAVNERRGSKAPGPPILQIEQKGR